MTMRKIAVVAMLLGAYGCSSSSNNVTDGGKDAKDATTDSTDAKDAPTTDGGDAAGDVAAETGGDVAAETGGTDGGDGGTVLTPLQARGSYLVNAVIACSDCHTPRKADGTPDMTKFLAGNADFIKLPNGDRLPSKNLTNDATGLKNRTDAEIKDMFMNGKRPVPAGAGSDAGAGDGGADGGTDGGDGGAATTTVALNPVMPYYVFHNLTAADADAIVAYLRTVPGVNNEIPRRSAAFDVAAPANPLDPNKIPLPQETFAERESALRGRYLAAESGLCIECHTKHQMAADVLDMTKLFAGGEDFSGPVAALMIHPVSKNLTSDTTTGLGTWTAADIVNAVTKGKAKDGTGICPPMPSGPMGAYGGLLASDAMDIANYIKSLPPIVNNVPDMCVFPAPAPDGGTDGATDGASEAGGDTAATDASGG